MCPLSTSLLRRGLLRGAVLLFFAPGRLRFRRTTPDCPRVGRPFRGGDSLRYNTLGIPSSFRTRRCLFALSSLAHPPIPSCSAELRLLRRIAGDFGVWCGEVDIPHLYRRLGRRSLARRAMVQIHSLNKGGLILALAAMRPPYIPSNFRFLLRAPIISQFLYVYERIRLFGAQKATRLVSKN